MLGVGEWLWLLVMAMWVLSHMFRLLRNRWIPNRRVLLAVEVLSAVGLGLSWWWPLLGIGLLVLLMMLRVSLWGALFQGGADVVFFWAGVTAVVSLSFPDRAELAQRIFVGVFLIGYGVAALKKGWAWGSTLVSLHWVSSYPVRRVPVSDRVLKILGNAVPVLQGASALSLALGPPVGYLGLLFWLGFHFVVGWTFGLWRFASGYFLVLVAWHLLHHPH